MTQILSHPLPSCCRDTNPDFPKFPKLLKPHKLQSVTKHSNKWELVLIFSLHSGFRKQELRRTSYAGETNNSLQIARFGASSSSEPKLYRRQTLIRNKNRVSYAETCKADGEDTEKPANKRLRKMKAQSKRTFKFRKTRRRDIGEENQDQERHSYDNRSDGNNKNVKIEDNKTKLNYSYEEE